jgi:hypothetical protein
MDSTAAFASANSAPVRPRYSWIAAIVLPARTSSTTLTNAGPCPLTVTDITSSSTEFLVPNVLAYPFPIAPGTGIAVPIRFRPEHHGTNTATITVFSDDPSGPDTVAVSGHVPSGRLRVYGSTYFGEIDCGIAQKTLSICNVGDCRLFVSSVEFSREWRNFKTDQQPVPRDPACGLVFGSRDSISRTVSRSAVSLSSIATILRSHAKCWMSAHSRAAKGNAGATKRPAAVTVGRMNAARIAADLT